MTPEQCEARKQDSIDWQRLKKQKSEITLEEYTKRRDELIARRKSQHAKWAAAAKLLDIKTESA